MFAAKYNNLIVNKSVRANYWEAKQLKLQPYNTMKDRYVNPSYFEHPYTGR